LKLLTKTTLYFITIVLLVLFIGGIVFYFYFKSIVRREVDNELTTNMHHFALILHTKNFKLDSTKLLLPLGYAIKPLAKINPGIFSFKDTIMFDLSSQRYQTFRVIQYQTYFKKTPLQLSIQESLIIIDELIERVAVAIFFLTLFLLGGIFAFNRYFIHQIWSKFFQTLETIQSIEISKNDKLELPVSEIYEFTLLNAVFDKMISRIRNDYFNLKEFTENISHEIQNPLAIIKSKIELLSQNEKLDEEQIKLIHSLQSNAVRLSNLDKSLILLAKINNNQFSERENINIIDVINFHLSNFEDVIQTKQITVQNKINSTFQIHADINLINILILNLLKNAVRHNLKGGTIDLAIEQHQFIIGNTGNEQDVNPDEMFKRFAKATGQPESLGLGLAIIDKICEYYNYTIQYLYNNKYHKFIISF